MSKMIFYDELSDEAKKYAICLETMKKAIKEKIPLFTKKITRSSVKKFLTLLPELQRVVDAIESQNYFPMGSFTRSQNGQTTPQHENVLEFSFTSDYSVDGQNLWWSPTSPKHTVMFDEVNEPINIEQDPVDKKNLSLT
jgi:hypothetical protein